MRKAILPLLVVIFSRLAFADYTPSGRTVFTCGHQKFLVEDPGLSCDIVSECGDSGGNYIYSALVGKKEIKLKEQFFYDHKPNNDGSFKYKKMQIFFDASGLYLDEAHKKPCKASVRKSN